MIRHAHATSLAMVAASLLLLELRPHELEATLDDLENRHVVVALGARDPGLPILLHIDVELCGLSSMGQTPIVCIQHRRSFGALPALDRAAFLTARAAELCPKGGLHVQVVCSFGHARALTLLGPRRFLSDFQSAAMSSRASAPALPLASGPVFPPVTATAYAELYRMWSARTDP